MDHADKDDHDRELQLNGGGVDFHEHSGANGQGEGVVNNTELRSFRKESDETTEVPNRRGGKNEIFYIPVKCFVWGASRP